MINLKDEFNSIVAKITCFFELPDGFTKWKDKGDKAIADIESRKTVVAAHMAMGMNMPEGSPYAKEVETLNKCVIKLKEIYEENVSFEIFAISEEGTENVEFADTEEEAKTKVIKLFTALNSGKWDNTTSLTHVIGFNYDRGPENE